MATNNVLRNLYIIHEDQVFEAIEEPRWKPGMMVFSSFGVIEMIRRRKESLTAQLYCKAAEEAARACYLLHEKDNREAFKMLHRAWSFWYYDICDSQPFAEVAVRVIQEQPDDHLALSIALFSPQFSSQESLEMARRCVQLDPSNDNYRLILSRIYFHLKRYEEADVALALGVAPTYRKLAAKIEIHMKSNSVDDDTLAEMIEKYLCQVPIHFFYVAECLYIMAFIWCKRHEQSDGEETDKLLRIADSYYHDGLEAESSRFKHFGPVDAQVQKQYAADYLHRHMPSRSQEDFRLRPTVSLRMRPIVSVFNF
jgi:tetratricopeptide (TPR) repeat protein